MYFNNYIFWSGETDQEEVGQEVQAVHVGAVNENNKVTCHLLQTRLNVVGVELHRLHLTQVVLKKTVV